MATESESLRLLANGSGLLVGNAVDRTESISHDPQRLGPPDELEEVLNFDQEDSLAESPAKISPAEATTVCDQLWASGIDRLNTLNFAQPSGNHNLRLFTFHRIYKLAEQALLNSPLAERTKEAGTEVQPSWAKGAKIFVKFDPEILDVVLDARHVVVDAHDEQDVVTILESLPYNQRPDRSLVVAE